MVKHIVLFKFKDKKDIQTAMTHMQQMKGKIDGMIDLEVGENFVADERNFDVALTCTFVDKSALDFYQVHPVHVQVKKMLPPILDKIVVVDYQI